VLLRNTRLISNLSFFALSVSISAWAVSLYFTEADASLSVNSLFNKLSYLFGYLCIMSVVVFCYNFPLKTVVKPAYKILFVATVVLGSLASVTSLVAGKVSRNSSELTFTVGPLLPFMAILLFLFFGLSLYRLFINRRKRDDKTRNQINLIISGFAISGLLGMCLSVVMPSILKDFEMAKYGPLLTIILVGTTTYAIVKHGLFNIRLVIARSIAYIALITSFSGIYSLVVFGIASNVADSDSVVATKVVPIAVALFLVFTGPYLKKFFDNVTSTLFYRDAYDPQTFLDRLNKTLVSNIEIGILLRHTATVIEENLKASCHVHLPAAATGPNRTIGNTSLVIKQNQLDLIKSELATISKKTVVTDDLGSHYLELKNALYINDIAVISSLVTSYAANKEATAYLMLGPKKSGNGYSKQDLRIIDIVTDELLIAIQNALRFEEIQSFNITLQNRINDATAKLKRSNEKLKELDETKDEFISMASHQLRTPLTSVKGYLSMVLDGDAGKITETQQQLLNQAFVSSQRMVFLIADLLNVSRLKTGKFIIDKSPTDLSEMVESELAQLTEVAKSRNLTLTYDKPKDFPIVELDETKTRQVVMNFVDNAIYYTPSGGKIKLELTSDRRNIYFMVKDNGLGVPKDEQAHLFTKFYRAKNAQKARPDGTGLGLFMAKKVINEQGGTLLFESTEGKGSTFGFKFSKTPTTNNAN